MNPTDIYLGVGMFIVIVVALVMIITFAKSKLMSTGDVKILINDDPSKAITVAPGGKLLGALADNGILSRLLVAAVAHVGNVGSILPVVVRSCQRSLITLPRVKRARVVVCPAR